MKRRRILSENRETLLIYRLGSLGDTIVALPCFHRIQAAYPNSRRIALTNAPISSKAAPLSVILRGGDFIEGAIDYPVGTRNPLTLLKLIVRIRTLGAKTAIHLCAGRVGLDLRRDLAFLRACGINKVIGAPTTAELAHVKVDSLTGELELEASRLARCLYELGPIDVADPANLDLRLTANEVAVANDFLSGFEGEPFFVINTGGKVKEKDWGEANWTVLLQTLADRLNLGLLVVGGADDSAMAGRLIALWPRRALNACGLFSPRVTSALMGRARFFVGHDSGPMHLAYAAGLRCVSLFGSLNQPRQWYPIGEGHIILHDQHSVTNIPTAVVARAVETLASNGSV